MNAYIEPIPPLRILNYVGGIFRSGSNFNDVLLTSRGRDAIQLAIDFLEIKKSDAVLLPALTCDTVSGVFSGNCRTIYYDLKEDYSIQLSELEKLLNENPVIKLIYIIHYFGFIQKNVGEIASLCKKYDVILIEDHAHSALSKYDKDLADIHIYSFRKLFPTADGGGIHINRNGLKHNFHFKHKLIANQKGLLIAFKRKGSLYSKKFRSAVGKFIQKDIDRLNQGSTRINPLPVSSFGRGIISSSEIDKISAARREQYEKWNTLIDTTPFTPLFFHLDNGTVPLGFPIKLQNNREMIDHFKKFNVFLKVHWLAMPPGTKSSCPISNNLAETSITLPIYPGLKDKEMRFIKDELLKHGIPYK